MGVVSVVRPHPALCGTWGGPGASIGPAPECAGAGVRSAAWRIVAPSIDHTVLGPREGGHSGHGGPHASPSQHQLPGHHGECQHH